MWEKLTDIEKRCEELHGLLSNPDVIANKAEFQKYTKEYSGISKIADKYREYKKISSELEKANELLKSDDAEIKALAREEINSLGQQKHLIEEELGRMLIPPDPFDEKNTIIEIRAGTGGDEAALFAADLFRMYVRYAEKKRWKTSTITSHPSELGGFKEVVFLIEGERAYSHFKYERGVHRVQRVPTTETGGRIHTSAVTVAVLPEAEEIDVVIASDDLKIDRYCSSGPGGQSVNTTYSAVRITHLPTGIVVQCQDERSQLKNKEKAMKVLKSHILVRAKEEQDKEIAKQRKVQVGSGDRSEKIRTYNFPQDRITDHRIGLSLRNLEDILAGNIDEIIENLKKAEQEEKMKELGSQQE
ncbi:MAG: peptide chain release factor 1 [bacterium]